MHSLGFLHLLQRSSACLIADERPSPSSSYSLKLPLRSQRRELRAFARRRRVPAQDATTAIEVQDLCFSLTGNNGRVTPILRNCQLRVPMGQLWMLLGPNGCGKSTLLKILAGLLNPTSGTVFVNTPKSFVFQNPEHQIVMPTVEADVAFGLGKFDLSAEEVNERVSNALNSVGMAKYIQRPVQTLSGGQKQRVAIAGALAEACKVLLLDELTTFLDVKDQLGVIKAVKSSVNTGVAALWVTHRLEELKYADGAFYMEDGQIVKQMDASNVANFI
ncbi:ABC transporter family protein [Wolffia australiana]